MDADRRQAVIELRERAAKVLAYPVVAGMPKGGERRARFAETVQELLKS